MFQRTAVDRMTTRSQQPSTTQPTLVKAKESFGAAEVKQKEVKSTFTKAKESTIAKPKESTFPKEVIVKTSNQTEHSIIKKEHKAVETKQTKDTIQPQKQKETQPTRTSKRLSRGSVEEPEQKENVELNRNRGVKRVQEAKQPIGRKKVEREVVGEKTEEPTIVTRSKTGLKLEVPEEMGWEDLDKDDGLDPVMVSEYVVEIFEYLKELEVKTLPNPNYMENQEELQWKMRSILVDWLIEVHLKFKLLPETLFLAVNILDRFLSLRPVNLKKLQLVGVTSLFIASKYEEVYAPSISQFVYISDGGYSTDEIIKAERYMLSTLEFGLHFPNPLNFLRRCSKADDYDIQTRTVAKYFMEVMMLHEANLDVCPSKSAAISLYLARAMLNRGPWNANLVHYSGYTVAQLRPYVLRLVRQVSESYRFTAINKKYEQSKFLKAKPYVECWISAREAEKDYRINWV